MTTLRDAIQRYRNVLEVTHRPESVKTYLCRLRFLKNNLGEDTLLTEISLAMLEQALATYRKPRKPNTVALAVTVWREFFVWCDDVGLRGGSPAARLRAPKRTKWKPRAMSEAAIEELLRRIRADIDVSNWRDIRNESIVRLLIVTGLRRAELAGLEWQDVDLLGALVTVEGKGGKKRTIPLSKTALHILQRLQAAQARHYGAVFAKKDGTRLHTYTINAIFQRWCQQKLGIVVTPHVLRHSFATMLVERGASLDEVRDLLGHESIATTQVYVHTSMERLRKAVNRLEQPKGNE